MRLTGLSGVEKFFVWTLAMDVVLGVILRVESNRTYIDAAWKQQIFLHIMIEAWEADSLPFLVL